MTETISRAKSFWWFLTGSLLMFAALLIIAVFSTHLVAATAEGQQKTPTVEQCRADLGSWAKDEKPDSLSAAEMENRSGEMLKCYSIDSPENHEANDAYSTMAKHYGFWLEVRMADFIVRHNMWKQFHDEDAQGLR